MSFDVALAACGSYEESEVLRALEEAVDATDGLDFVRPGMRIGVKLNLVSAMKPESAATVHPAVVCALVRMLRERGAEVVLGDSPGGLFNAAHLKSVYETCGMRAAEELGAKLNDDFSTLTVSFPEGAIALSFPYTAWLTKVDAVIDLCKLKSHGMMGMTCAVKNFFGTVPGTQKPEFHYRYPKAEDFADMLIDLCEYSAPRLCICDAVVGMEGNGPTQGSPRKIGCVMVSKSAHALDAVAAGLIGLEMREVPTLLAAQKRGFVGDASGISVYGDREKFTQKDFKTVPAQTSVFFLVFGDGPLGRLTDCVAARVMTPFPRLSPAECIGCGKCARTCPAGAITMKDAKPRIDRGKCIHCFCCQEFCPKGAMKVGRHAIMRMLGK